MDALVHDAKAAKPELSSAGAGAGIAPGVEHDMGPSEDLRPRVSTQDSITGPPASGSDIRGQIYEL